MKKIWITTAFVAFSTIAIAQNNDDKLQQQPPRETQRTLERSSKAEAVKEASNAEVEAEKLAKDKAQTQKQTKAQPVGLNPNDSVSPKRAHKK